MCALRVWYQAEKEKVAYEVIIVKKSENIMTKQRKSVIIVLKIAKLAKPLRNLIAFLANSP